MLQLVKLALSKPYTFVVLAILILLGGSIAWTDTPTDIFPDIKIPVIAVVWTYNGLPPEDMAGRVLDYYERSLSTTVNDIEHIESQSLDGVGVVKIFFQPGVDIRTATAQVTSISQTVLKQMPPGITPPQILNYNASTVPILQLALSSKTCPSSRSSTSARTASARAGDRAGRGAAHALWRQAAPDPDRPRTRSAAGAALSATDVGTALAAQNQIVPAGTARSAPTNTTCAQQQPGVIDELNDLPIKTVDGATVYMRDVATSATARRRRPTSCASTAAARC